MAAKTTGRPKVFDDQTHISTLDQFQITRFYSHSVQMELNCPEVKVEEYIRQTREVGEVVTGAVYRLGHGAHGRW